MIGQSSPLPGSKAFEALVKTTWLRPRPDGWDIAEEQLLSTCLKSSPELIR